LKIAGTILASSLFLGNLSGGQCVRPSTTMRSPEDTFAFSAAAVAALATAHLAYQESILSPEMTVGSSETLPLVAAKACVDTYMRPFAASPEQHIREGASGFQLAMYVLHENERVVADELVRMSRNGGSADARMAYVKEYRDSGLGRWAVFSNLALSTIFAIAHFEDAAAGKTDLLLDLEPEEALFLRLEILKHFRVQRLMRPTLLRPSPEKGSAILYRLLKEGRLRANDPEWK
jgi:hypothetical protein